MGEMSKKTRDTHRLWLGRYSSGSGDINRERLAASPGQEEKDMFSGQSGYEIGISVASENAYPCSYLPWGKRVCAFSAKEAMHLAYPSALSALVATYASPVPTVNPNTTAFRAAVVIL
jgi:hypothetical protein